MGIRSTMGCVIHSYLAAQSLIFTSQDSRLCSQVGIPISHGDEEVESWPACRSSAKATRIICY